MCKTTSLLYKQPWHVSHAVASFIADKILCVPLPIIQNHCIQRSDSPSNRRIKNGVPATNNRRKVGETGCGRMRRSPDSRWERKWLKSPSCTSYQVQYWIESSLVQLQTSKSWEKQGNTGFFSKKSTGLINLSCFQSHGLEDEKCDDPQFQLNGKVWWTIEGWL